MDDDKLRAAAQSGNEGGRIVVPQEMVDKARHMAEVQAGLRCVACGDRFEHGFAAILIAQRWDPSGEPIIAVNTVSVCGVCDDSGGVLREATAMREVRQRFLEDGTPVSLPAKEEVQGDG